MTIPSSEIQSFRPHPWSFEQISSYLPSTGKVLEIGAYLGKSAVSWAEAFASAGHTYDIHTVDAFGGIKGNVDSGNCDNDEFLQSLSISEEDHLETFQQNINGWSNITWEKNVFDENYTPPDGFEDPTVIFYDAFHSYEAVTSFINWCEGKSSIIIIDDYDIEGTKRAVDESTQLQKVYEEPLGGIVVLVRS